MANTRLYQDQLQFDDSLDLQSQKIINVLDPTLPQDVATKNYVDLAVQGISDAKDAVRVATTANITLSGLQTIDGVSLSAGDRVLVKNQTLGQNNGIYVVAAGAWSRSTDADTSAKVTQGMYTVAAEGTTQQGGGFLLTTPDPITLGTTPLTFILWRVETILTFSNGLARTGNQVDVVAGDNSLTSSPGSLVVKIDPNGGLQTSAAGVNVKIDGTNLSKSSLGLKIADGTAGQILVANVSGVFTATTLSGDVSAVSGSGAVTIVSASETVAGKIEIATQTETNTGTDDVRAVTPLKLKTLLDTRIVTENFTDGAGFTAGTTTPISLTNTPYTTFVISLNGAVLTTGASNDYVLTGASLQLYKGGSPRIWKTGDTVQVTYIY